MVAVSACAVNSEAVQLFIYIMDDLEVLLAPKSLIK